MKIYHAVCVLTVQRNKMVMPKDKLYGYVELADSLKGYVNYWKLAITLEEYKNFKPRERQKVWFEIVDIERDEKGNVKEAYAKFIQDFKETKLT